MQCDCITTFTNKVKEHADEQLSVSTRVECDNQGITFENNSLSSVVVINFTVKADKTGYKRGKQTKVIANFCPFCGTPAKKKEDQNVV